MVTRNCKVVRKRSMSARSLSRHKNLKLARNSARRRAMLNNKTYYIYKYSTTLGGLRRNRGDLTWNYVETISPKVSKK